MSMFDGIPEFLAVAETQGFSSAARRLGVATSQISLRVSDLEAKLGVALVARTTRKVKLTEAGLTYYEYCHDIVNQVWVFCIWHNQPWLKILRWGSLCQY